LEGLTVLWGIRVLRVQLSTETSIVPVVLDPSKLYWLLEIELLGVPGHPMLQYLLLLF